ncbi:MAG: hypothetical protein ACOY9J_03490 [Pseudomonadota bacterium]
MSVFTATQHYVCHMATDWERTIYIREDDGTTAVDLTGCSAVMKVVTAAAGTVLATPTVAITAGTGKIVFSMTDTVTAAIATAALTSSTVVEFVPDDLPALKGTGPTAVYSIEITWSDGKVDRLMEGNFCLVPRVFPS